MARKFTHDFYREAEDGTETLVRVEFTQTPIVPARTNGPPEDCYEAYGGEVEIQRAHTDADGWNAKWSDDEDEAWVTWLMENHDPDANCPD